ncbi:MAG: carboxypeptidase regulatory-like domain-containing protein [Saprospiraceae bacterium]|nr:carboxypeptidase regulatory-like domain-containing protein [Saprospiraceae bacterium]
MNLKIENYYPLGSLVLVFNLFLNTIIFSQQHSLCPVGVGVEPKAKNETSEPSRASQVFFPQFIAWSNPSFIRKSDNQKVAILLPGNKFSRVLRISDFKFNIPDGATINGITVNFYGQSDKYIQIDEVTVKLTDKNGVAKGQNKANTALLQKAWNQAKFGRDHKWCYGSKSDNWGANWTTNDVNSKNFGIELQIRNMVADTVNIELDYIDIIIDYTPLYSFCDGKCLTFFIDKFEKAGSYVWDAPVGFDVVSGSSRQQTIDLDIENAPFGIHEICVDIYDKNGNFSETCCRKFSYLDCNAASINGIVWLDQNDNNKRDTGESVLSGISVQLYNSSDSLIDTQMTDNNGNYHFEALQNTSYYLKVPVLSNKIFVLKWNDFPEINSDITNSNGPGTTEIIPVEVGAQIQNIDFGYKPLLSIGNYVWEDKNYNGTQDANEPGIPGVKVLLLHSDMVVQDSTVTDADGNYMFNNITANQYFLRFLPTSDYIPTSIKSISDPLSNKVGLNGQTSLHHYKNSGVYDTLDAGFFRYGSIGNFVWEDLNANGIQDIGEPGIAGLDVVLTGLTGDGTEVLEFTSTGLNGQYLFENLKPGNYTVSVRIPAIYKVSPYRSGVDPTVDNDALFRVIRDDFEAFAADVTLMSGENNLTIDIGLYKSGSIGDFVWEDLNANGIQDIGEPGISDITLRISGTAGDGTSLDRNILTDANGKYIFENLTPGIYQIEATIPANYNYTSKGIGSNADVDSDIENGFISDITITSGQQDLSQDIGLFRSGFIGDFVWEDLNGNGIRDVGEPGISGVSVSLNGETGAGINISLTTVTDQEGNYSFDNLVPGIYNLIFSPPVEFNYTAFKQGTDNTLDSDTDNGQINAIQIASGAVQNNLDVGLFRYSSVEGFVWDDLNGNGLQDDSEPGIDGILLSLSGTTGTGEDINLNTVSDQEGLYHFSNLKPGIYTATIIVPDGFSLSLPFSGDDSMLDSDFDLLSKSYTITLISNDIIKNKDAGLIGLSSVGDLVWEDLNCNGLFETGEPGIEGMIIQLIGITNQGAAVNLQTNSVNDGSYQFGNLLPGNYTVEFFPAQGFEFSENINSTFELFSKDNLTDLDAAFFRRGSIGDRVWNDLNENGIQDEGEEGVAYLEVTLSGTAGGNAVFLQTETDADGLYIFDQLKPGIYNLSFDIPLGFAFTQQSQGNDRTKDSDVDGSGNIYNIELLSGQTLSDYDAGIIFASTGSIGNFVWEDLNGNGLQDNGEPGIRNVVVTLEGTTTIGSTIQAIRITDNNGQYTFSDLQEGTYRITFSKPSGYEFTISIPDVNSNSDADPLTGITAEFILNQGSQLLGVDAGLFRFSSIGDRVWLDENQNGILDNGEQGIAGLNLKLKRTSDDSEINSLTSGNFGFYFFTNIVPGEYYIEAVLPEQYTITSPFEGDSSSDSDFINTGGTIRTNNISIISNTTLFDIDLGLILIPLEGSTGGFAWFDANGNGIKDDIETGFDSVQVILYNAVGDSLDTQFTDSEGFYKFENLTPGSYSIAFDKLDDLLFTLPKQGGNTFLDSDVTDFENGHTDLFTVNAGQNNFDISAGYVNKSSVGDFVWVDSNEDGIQDSDEPGLNNVKIRLFTANGILIDSTTSGVNIASGKSGYYSFNNLNFGDYYLIFQLPDNFEFTINNQGDSDKDSDVSSAISQGSTDIFTLSPGESRMDIDAGYVLAVPVTGSISGKVWEDKNNNLIRDSDENEIADIIVSLFSAAGNLLGTQISDASGDYVFSNIPFGDYYLSVPTITDKVFVLKGGENTALDSDITGQFGTGSTSLITLFPGANLENIDFGYADKISIGDFVWDDLNNNGLQDEGEPGIMGVKVELINQSGQVVQTTTSDQNGNYILDNVAVGTYSLQFESANGYLFAISVPDPENKNSKTNFSGLTPQFTFSSPGAYTNVDAGYVKSGVIGDHVWLDLNGNGVQTSNEPGISGVEVSLFTWDGIFVQQVTTGIQPGNNFSGFYQFTGVRPGEYYVQFAVPSDYILSPPLLGDEESDSNITGSNGTGTTDIFAILPGEINNSIDAGAYLPATLGDFVWNDINKNGIQEANEPGIPGVSVSLFAQNGLLIGTTTTNDDGFYSFTDLRQRLYYLQFQLIPGYEFTIQNAGDNGMIDSDVDATGTTPLISLAHGATFLGVDAGMFVTENNIILGTLWKDENKNGIRDENEDRLDSINVFLVDDLKQIMIPTHTNHAGMYCVATKSQGEYYIMVEPIESHIFTDKGVGNDPMIDSDLNNNGLSDMLALMPDTVVLDYIDAGMYYKAFSGIEGKIWIDNNGNNELDELDSGLPNVPVLIFNKSRVFIRSTKSDESGNYSMNGLDPGQYYCLVPNFEDKDFIYFNPEVEINYSNITNQYGMGTTRLIILEEGKLYTGHHIGYKYKSENRNYTGSLENRALNFDKIKLQPNPAQWYIDINANRTDDVSQYFIFNVNGEVVKNGKITDMSTRIFIQNLPAGRYSVNILNSEGMMSKSFLKMDY